MPVISRFFGIVITMQHREHFPPHFHARYAEHQASIGFAPPGVIAGSLPPRVLALVIEWAALRERELLADWALAREYRPLDPIDPLG